MFEREAKFKYQLLCEDPVQLAEFITNYLDLALRKFCRITGTVYVPSTIQYEAVKGKILSELMEKVAEQ